VGKQAASCMVKALRKAQILIHLLPEPCPGPRPGREFIAEVDQDRSDTRQGLEGQGQAVWRERQVCD
jgi:hypothetical protein